MGKLENPGCHSAERSVDDATSVTGKSGLLVPFEAPAIAAPSSQAPASLIAAAPLADELARGLVVIQYRTENIRIVAVFGAAAVRVVPRIGHLHITIDDAAWHWVDASGEPLIVQGLATGAHRVRIDLADPAHRVIDSVVVEFEIPALKLAQLTP